MDNNDGRVVFDSVTQIQDAKTELGALVANEERFGIVTGGSGYFTAQRDCTFGDLVRVNRRSENRAMST